MTAPSPCLDEAALIAFAEKADVNGSRNEMERHLDGCARCRDLLVQLTQLGLLTTGNRLSATLPAEADAEETLHPGAQLARYRVRELLGQGGWGSVFAADDPALHRKVALKVSRAPPSEQQEASNHQLLREAQTIAQLRHPGVVSIYDVGIEDGRVFIAMELMTGGTLGDWLRARPRPWREVLEVFIRAGQGLSAAHEAGLVHRDFKPANVLMGEAGRACLTDFGLSKPAGAGEQLQATGWVGTPAYMAPEQLAGGSGSALSDQFSYAVALYEGLSGSRPFEGSTMRTLHDAMKRGLSREQLKALPAPLRGVLSRALAFAPEARFESLAALLRALSRAAGARRRALSWAAGLGMACAAGAAVTQRIRAARACERETATLSRVWNEAEARALQARFQGTGLEFAAPSFVEVRRQLDAFGQTWTELTRETCAGARDGGVSPAVAAQRRACLKDSRLRFSATLDLLKQMDRSGVAGAPLLTGALPRPNECRSARAVTGDSPVDERRLDEVRQQAARAWALGNAQRFKEMEEPLAKMAVGLAAVSSPVLQGELHFLRGRSKSQLGAAKEARQSFEEALIVGHASAQDALIARTYIDLAALVGIEQGRREEASQLFRYAEAATSRLGPSPLRSALHRKWAWFRMKSGDEAGSITSAREAVAAARASFGEQTLEVASALDVLGVVSLQAGDSAQALASHQKALELRERILGPSHPSLAAVLGNMAHVYRQQTRYDDALACLERARVLTVAAAGEHSLAVANILSSLSNVHYSRGQLQESLALAHRSLQTREALMDPDNPELVRSLANISVNLDGLLRYDEGAAFRARARSLLERTHSSGSLMWTYVESQEARSLLARRMPEQALKRIREVIAVQVKSLGPANLDLMRMRLDESDILRELGRVREALAILETLRPRYAEAHGPQSADHGDLLGRLGLCHAMLGADAVALPELEESLRLHPELRQDSSSPALVRAALALSLSRTGGDVERIRTLQAEARTAAEQLAPVFSERIRRLLQNVKPI